MVLDRYRGYNCNNYYSDNESLFQKILIRQYPIKSNDFYDTCVPRFHFEKIFAKLTVRIIRKKNVIIINNVTAMSFDKGEGLYEKMSPFDTFVQVIEGKANIVIDKESHILNMGRAL